MSLITIVFRITFAFCVFASEVDVKAPSLINTYKIHFDDDPAVPQIAKIESKIDHFGINLRWDYGWCFWMRPTKNLITPFTLGTLGGGKYISLSFNLTSQTATFDYNELSIHNMQLPIIPLAVWTHVCIVTETVLRGLDNGQKSTSIFLYINNTLAARAADHGTKSKYDDGFDVVILGQKAVNGDTTNLDPMMSMAGDISLFQIIWAHSCTLTLYPDCILQASCGLEDSYIAVNWNSDSWTYIGATRQDVSLGCHLTTPKYNPSDSWLGIEYQKNGVKLDIRS